MTDQGTQRTDAGMAMQAEGRECILCGRCLEVCPLFCATGREELSPRGKSFLISQALEQGKLGDPEAARKLLGLCLGCGRCVQACPQGRNLPALLRTLKAGHPGWQAWVWQAWIRGARHVWPWLGTCARILPGRPSSGSAMAGLQALGHGPLTPALIRRVAGAVTFPSPAALFPGCMARWAKPWWIKSAAVVLGPTGSELRDFPDWNCCGFTLGQAGLSKTRLEMCRANIDIWRRRGRPLLLTICATCCTALRGYAEQTDLFADAAERSLWSQAVRPLSEFLDHRDFARLGEGRVMYHHPCHAPHPDPDAIFLQGVLGEAFSESAPNACCGLGGVMRLYAPELSAQVSARYWETASGRMTRHVATGCSGCVLQLAASAPEHVDVTHWLELFAAEQDG